jgi:hypothetical protein
VEAYEFETTQIVKRFLQHRLEFPECITELDAALARFTPRITNEQIGRLRIVVLANNEIIMKEMERRSANAEEHGRDLSVR